MNKNTKKTTTAKKTTTKKTTTKKTTKKTTTPLPYVILRCTAAGVHAGELVSKTETSAVLRNSRRIWGWTNSARCLSDLSQFGLAKPQDCEFGVLIPDDATICGYCEILPVTAVARASIESVPQWRV
jgi:hypothetical protein